MTKEEVRRRILEVGVVPVVRAASAKQAHEACEAVSRGGIPVVEVTMTVPGALEVIAELERTVGADVLVGAGTVCDSETAIRCIDAGAKFLVSPGFDAATVQEANRQQVLIMAGALTPTEVITAWKAGADFVKIFPCGNLGGAKYIKALKGPLPHVPMVPTGGVNLDTAAAFIHAGAAALGIGGELVNAEALASGNLDAITQAAMRYVEIVASARTPQVKAIPAKT